jgi:sulfur transfer complex TusBCD TusB component (DsrH family)
MRILHIIKKPDDVTPFDIAGEQKKNNEVTILLLHDAVYVAPGKGIYACAADVEARGVLGHTTVDYDMIVSMIFENDKVVSW